MALRGVQKFRVKIYTRVHNTLAHARVAEWSRVRLSHHRTGVCVCVTVCMCVRITINNRSVYVYLHMRDCGEISTRTRAYNGVPIHACIRACVCALVLFLYTRVARKREREVRAYAHAFGGCGLNS